jgi:hypothetical protein
MSNNVISFSKKPITDTETCREETVAGSDATAAAADAPYVLEALRERTPAIFPHAPIGVQMACRELGLPNPLLVPVHPIENPNPINYIENIARAMLIENGRPVFGRKFRTTPLWVVAEFHAMFKTDTGLVDVTPNNRGEHFAVFAPDYDIPPDFDFLDRPVTLRVSTYEAPTRQERVAAEIGAMEPRRRAAEQRRAADLGMTLEDTLSLHLVADPLETRMGLYFECCDQLEAMTMAALDGREAIDLKHFEFLHRRKETLGMFVEEAFAEHQAAQRQRKRSRR